MSTRDSMSGGISQLPPSLPYFNYVSNRQTTITNHLSVRLRIQYVQHSGRRLAPMYCWQLTHWRKICPSSVKKQLFVGEGSGRGGGMVIRVAAKTFLKMILRKNLEILILRVAEFFVNFMKHEIETCVWNICETQRKFRETKSKNCFIAYPFYWSCYSIVVVSEQYLHQNSLQKYIYWKV